MQCIKMGDFVAELFSQNLGKLAAISKENNQNFQQYFIYNVHLIVFITLKVYFMIHSLISPKKFGFLH